MKKTILKAAIVLLGVGLYACNNQNNPNSQTQKEEKMENNRVIEVTFIQPKAGISMEVFGKRNVQVEFDYTNKQPGFISRETAVDENGSWVLIVHWENLESA